MTLGQLVGILLMFALFMVPAGLFVGIWMGNALKLRRGARIAAALICAAISAYGVVYHGGASDDCYPSEHQRC